MNQKIFIDDRRQYDAQKRTERSKIRRDRAHRLQKELQAGRFIMLCNEEKPFVTFLCSIACQNFNSTAQLHVNKVLRFIQRIIICNLAYYKSKIYIQVKERKKVHIALNIFQNIVNINVHCASKMFTSCGISQWFLLALAYPINLYQSFQN
jgi:hypothetical protein